MTEQEIRDNAPSGANSYLIGVFGDVVYLKKQSQFTTYFNEKRKKWYLFLSIGYFDIKPL